MSDAGRAPDVTPSAAADVPVPHGLVAELTHRCPLACPYCSNPLALVPARKELPTETWCAVLDEAAALGVVQLHLSGGEPASRRDLEAIVARAARLGLYSNLITSGIGLGHARLEALAAAGLDHVQISIQDAVAESSDQIAGYDGAYQKKRELARSVRTLGLPLTINAPVHRRNLNRLEAIIALAVELGAARLEIAHVQYYAWALVNRAQLMPTREQVRRSLDIAAAARERLKGVLAIDFVAPDYYARRPKPCVGGWGRGLVVVTPEGKVLPCHAAETIPGLTFERVGDRPLAAIWRHSVAFNAFRGTGWMREPCRDCEHRTRDWGGCRCQALALAGDAAATDPACEKSSHHDMIRSLADHAAAEPEAPLRYRRP